MSDFRRVYQGGHHDVWCDGETHVRCSGGYVWKDRPAPVEGEGKRFRCDCAKWAKESAA